MPQRAPIKQSAPAEILAQLNMGLNLFTDPTQTNYRMWAAASNVFSGPFNYIQRARFANVKTVSPTTGQAFTSLKFYAVPTLSDYLLGDIAGKMYQFDSGASYAQTQLINQYVDPSGAGSSQLNGPWSREVLQNIAYGMNGQVKQAERLKLPSDPGGGLEPGGPDGTPVIEGWGLDAPDVSPTIVINSGNSYSLATIQRAGNVVTATVTGAMSGYFTSGPPEPFVNINGVSDATFNGSFMLTSALFSAGTTTLTWSQIGLNSGPISASGTIDNEITKAVGRSYSWAWENANKAHVGAPSPSSPYIPYTAQWGQLNFYEVGTVSGSGTTITGTGTAFSPGWVGRNIVVGNTPGVFARITAVASATSMTVASSIGSGPLGSFIIYDPQATHIRLYATADGGATYFLIARSAWTASVGIGNVTFLDGANAEPPNSPFTTETSQLYNVPPPIGAFIKEYQGRIIVYGVPGVEQTFFYSNQELTLIGQPQESFAPLNQVTLPIQNARINGMAEMPNSLIIWSDRQDMFRLTGLLTDTSGATTTTTSTTTGTQTGSTLAALPYNLGCASPFAVALTPLGAIWLTPNFEVWLFTDAYAPRNIGQSIQPLLQTITPGQLSNARMAYYHTTNRNWVALACATNGSSSNNTLLVLDLDLLAANGSPSFFVFDMATNSPVWYKFDMPCTALETMYEANLVRLFAATTDAFADADYQGSGFGTEQNVTGSVRLHAWGNDSAQVIKRPTFFRFVSDQAPSNYTSQGWAFAVNAIDDDVYTFNAPLVLNLVPGTNDTATLCGNPNLATSGESFRFSQALFRIGGVNFIAGRRIQFGITFPSAPGAFAFREIQVASGAQPPS